MSFNARIYYDCGCSHRVYHVGLKVIPELGDLFECEDHGETTVARTTYVSV